MRKTRSILTCLAILSAVMLCGEVFAQPGGGGPRGGGRRGPGGPGGPDGPGGRGGFGRMFEMLPIMAALDADKDGEISAAEIENAVAALKGLDKNEDGKLTADELRPERGPRGFGGPGGPGGAFGGRGGGPDPEQIADRIMSQDKNGDKKLTKEELTGERMESLFARADADKDESVTREELVAAIKQQVAEGGGRGRGGRGGFGFGGGRRGGDGPGADRPRRPARPE